MSGDTGPGAFDVARENDAARIVVDAALKVHKHLGPGLLESVCEMVLAYELRTRGLAVETQVPVDLVYESLSYKDAFRLDLLVNDCLVVELKSVEALQPVHSKQVVTYLRLTDKRLGLLLNFGSAYLRDGIKRIANNL